MRVVVYALSGVFGFVGFMFLVGNQGLTRRLIIGAVLIASALVSALLATLRTPPRPSAPAQQQPDMAPPLDLPTMLGQCKQCGATLPDDAYQSTAGTRSVLCPSCGTFYRIEEDSR